MPRTEEIANGSRTRGSNGRGEVRNEDRLKNLFNRSVTQRADWGLADPAQIAGVVIAVTRGNGAASFGTSRDGGAFSLTLFLDGGRETLWFNGDCDINAELENVMFLLGTVL